MKHILLPCTIVTVAFVMGSVRGSAIPAFARKYRTSCATCHVGFPKLNAFGDAFRRNAYQFPAHTDPEFIKEDPVSLGAEGNKAAFPDAIWPGSIPGSSPISLFLNGEIDYNPSTDPRFSFGGLGSSIESVIGGTLGEDLSFWGQVSFSDEGLELNRIFLAFSNLIGDSYALNARLGVFEPGLFSFSTHRAWMEGYWLTTRPFSDDMGWTMEETQKGIEVNGMVAGRAAYNVGLVEGFGSPHSDKDVYGHATYKFGGLPLDGVTSETTTAVDNTRPYVDNSATVGAFVYRGNAMIGADTLSQENPFTVVGGDLNVWYDRFNLFGGVGIRTDDHPFLGVPGTSARTNVLFGELDVVAFPWLLPGVRVESWKSQRLDSTGAAADYSDVQIVPGVMILIRPNVKMTLRTAVTKFDSNDDLEFKLDQVQLLVSVGI